MDSIVPNHSNHSRASLKMHFSRHCIRPQSILARHPASAAIYFNPSSRRRPRDPVRKQSHWILASASMTTAINKTRLCGACRNPFKPVIPRTPQSISARHPGAGRDPVRKQSHWILASALASCVALPSERRTANSV
jgi:hypothetical protein